jgi:hypothetical protein
MIVHGSSPPSTDFAVYLAVVRLSEPAPGLGSGWARTLYAKAIDPDDLRVV